MAAAGVPTGEIGRRGIGRRTRLSVRAGADLTVLKQVRLFRGEVLLVFAKGVW